MERMDTDSILAAARNTSGKAITVKLNDGCMLVCRPSAAWNGKTDELMAALKAAHNVNTEKRHKGMHR